MLSDLINKSRLVEKCVNGRYTLLEDHGRSGKSLHLIHH